MSNQPLTARADRRAAMPDSLDARREHIARALDSLRSESRRLERLGFEDLLRRCHAEKRYWSFLAAVHGVPVSGAHAIADRFDRLVTGTGSIG